MKFPILFLLAMLELWLAFPYGLKHEIPVMTLCAVAVTGAVLGVCIIAFIGDLWGQAVLRIFFGRHYERTQAWMRERSPLATGILSVLAPGLIGCSVTAALCISVGLPRRQVILTCSLGAVLWTLAWLSVISYIQK